MPNKRMDGWMNTCTPGKVRVFMVVAGIIPEETCYVQ